MHLFDILTFRMYYNSLSADVNLKIASLPNATKQKKDSPKKGEPYNNIYRYILSEECQQDTSSNGRTDYT